MLPILDETVVQELAIGLRSTREALNFLDRFDALLSTRLQKIHDALMSRDLEQMQIALLSLHTSAAMVGAARLHDCTGRIQQRLDGWPFSVPASRALMKDLGREAIQFTRAYRVLRSQQTSSDASSTPVPPQTRVDHPSHPGNPGDQAPRIIRTP